MKLLLVEDNVKLSDDIARYLGEQRFLVERAPDFRTGREKLQVYTYDLIVLDLNLPDGDGLHLLQLIRAELPETAVIILTARHTLEHKLKGLEWGADDYLTKPFHQAELNARIRSVLRRKKGHTNNRMELNEVAVDTQTAQVWVHEQLLTLTRKEYDLLLYLLYNPDRLLTKESIAEHLWGDHADQADNFDFIYNHIKNLRRKITRAGGRDRITSMYGMGYKWKTDS